MDNQTRNRKKKKSKKIYFIFGILSLLIVSGVSYFGFQYYQQSQKKKVVTEFVTQFEKKDFKKMVATLNEDSMKLNELTPDETTKKYETIFNNLNLTDIKGKISTFKKDYFELSFNMKTAYGKINDITYTGYVIKDKKKGYSIDWDYSFIFPEMEIGDKVFINQDSPKRGQLLDKNNQPLATEANYLQYGVVPNELGEGDSRASKIAAISDALEITVEFINQQLEQDWVKEDLFVPLKTLSQENPIANRESLNLQYQEIAKRYYPLKEAGAHLVGYTGSVTAEDLENDPTLAGYEIVGKTGLEAQLDKKLRGELGVRVEIVNQNNEVKKTIIESKVKDGKDIKLTIDSDIQQQAFNALDNLPGATVVTAPKTGELTAVVSSPSYDPNEFVLGISQKKYDAYSNDPANPFLARFAVGYAPGSTFKAITAAIGIDNNITTPDKTHEINGLKWQKDNSWGDYFVTRVSDSVTTVNMEDALVHSDNIYFSMETLELGEEKFSTGLEKFPFGEKMNVHIPMTPAQISNDGIKSDILLADTSYGQGQLLINPIQQAVMYSAFPNKGHIKMPKIIQEEESKDIPNVISENAAKLVNDALIQTVVNPSGTAHALLNEKTIAAKTGTAEIKEKQDTRGKENSFILAFNPEDGHYLILSLIEGADGKSAVQMNQSFIKSL